MFNGIIVNQENNADEATPEKSSNLFLAEMTQDVIQWDEGSNMDLDQKYRSPKPPGSDSKSENGSQSLAMTRTSTSASKSNTPLSTSTNSSSLFVGVKCQFDRSKSQTNPKKRQGSDSRSIPHSGELRTLPNSVDNVASNRDNSLTQRHRRRRLASKSTSVDVAQQRERQTTAPNNNFISTNQKDSKPEIERHDDFANLLDAITTPKSGQVTRAPLSPMDQNRALISKVLAENRIVQAAAAIDSPKNDASTTQQSRRHEPSTLKQEIRTFAEPNFHERSSNVGAEKAAKNIGCDASDKNIANSPDKSDEDEFGEIDFSEDDLAQIDSLTQVMPFHEATKDSGRYVDKLKANRDCSMGTLDKDLTKETGYTTARDTVGNEKIDSINQPTCIKETSDEFGDFPSDFDFSQIDAMVPTQPSTKNEEQSIPRPKPENQAQIAPSSTDIQKTSFNDNNLNQECMENEEQDEFGSFPNDLDFAQMDAVVDNQCHSSKPAPDTKLVEEDDEFGDFPHGIDFNVLDQVVTEKAAQARVIADPNSEPVRNQRTNIDGRGEKSFMNCSRYKVLSVEIDQRNGVKALRVAAWVNSMADSDEVVKKILKDGRVKATECHVYAEDNSCMFAHATKDVDYPEDGLLYLCGGDWYATPVRPGDVIHVCSLTGQYRTDTAALPIVLHSYPPPGSEMDDLILILHPEMLMSPSIISETASCNRRAALKSKMGSTGISSKSAFIGTMRHGLFEACMKVSEFDPLFAQRAIKKLIREKAEMLIGCNITEAEAVSQVLGALPMIQQFAKEYTTLRKDVMMLSSYGKEVGGNHCHPDIRLLVKGVHSVEENIVSTSLGLKGSIDAVLEAEYTMIGHKNSRPSSTSASCISSHPSTRQSLMCLELKTGHNQSIQNVHMAQLSLYTFMLQSRYGALTESKSNIDAAAYPTQNASNLGGAPGGILLYLNDKSQEINHVCPQMNEAKTLISQRNVVASDSKRALRPRGITLNFEEDQKENEDYLTAKLLPAPTANLPEVKSSTHSCERCFSKRECMLYAASDTKSDLRSHHDLISRFTGHLNEEDLEYFRKWDRLIDIEAKASSTTTSTPWLDSFRFREVGMNESMSGMVFDSCSSYETGTSDAMICFRWKEETCTQSSFGSLNITSGSHVIISTDGNPLDSSVRSSHIQKQPQNRMYVTKGCIDRIEEDRIFISTTIDELNQIKLLTSRYQDHAPYSDKRDCSSESLLFRLDKSTTSFGTGTIRWNLINFLTSDHTTKAKEERSQFDVKKQERLTWLRDVVIRLKTPEFVNDPHPSLFDFPDQRFPGCNLQELSEEYNSLNDAQQMAVNKAMNGRDYTLIQGLPGTGKTSTLGFLTRLLVARGRRVLITAYTHSAVDNIMSKLLEKGMGIRSQSGLSALVRLANRRPCQESLKSIEHTELALKFDKTMNIETSSSDATHPSAASLKEVIAHCRVLGVSALSLPRSPLLQSEHFDVVIIDEAGQMNEPTAIGALAAADSFILVGDHKQLPPLVNSSIADRGGYGVSILKRLADKHPHAIAPLTLQYRMNEAICQISSESIYGGKMKCGNERVRSQLLNLPGFPSSLPRPSCEGSIAWLRSIVDPERPVLFVDTDKIVEKDRSSRPKEAFVALEGKLGGSIVNRTEAKLVWHILKAMQLCGHDLSEIGVISPFRAQIKLIEDNDTVLPWKKTGLEMSTIDKYQGRDKSTIILSLVRSNGKGNAGRLLQDARRLNVAFTRAKCKLIVIGSYRTLSNGSAPLKPILKRMDTRDQRIQLPDNAVDCYSLE